LYLAMFLSVNVMAGQAQPRAPSPPVVKHNIR